MSGRSSNPAVGYPVMLERTVVDAVERRAVGKFQAAGPEEFAAVRGGDHVDILDHRENPTGFVGGDEALFLSQGHDAELLHETAGEHSTKAHPNLYLVGNGRGVRLEDHASRSTFPWFPSREAARAAAFAAGYREGGTLPDGTEWLGYVPGALPSPLPCQGERSTRPQAEAGEGSSLTALSEAISAVVAGLVIAGVIIDFVLMLPMPA